MKLLGKFVAVIREHAPYGGGEEQLLDLVGQAGLAAGEVFDPQGEGKAAGQVRTGDEIAAHAVVAPLDAVPGHAVSGGLGPIPLGLAFTAAPLHLALVEA